MKHLLLSSSALPTILAKNIFRNFPFRLYSVHAIKGQLTIGDVTAHIGLPKNPELVPQKYVKISSGGEVQTAQSALHHLRWMLQKDNLKQDIFLLGAPGCLRRNLAMQFLELTQRELEYIALSRDTTESDLKQRREITNKDAVYIDQCAVRAALNGRVLVLDGIEHAERNVLPILNNLLENREMHLEDGKFLMAPEKYDKLLEHHTDVELKQKGILRVSENFRVIALGLPTQKYKGTPLDPPFRSRFQSRNVTHFTFDEILSALRTMSPNADEEKLRRLISFGMTISATDTSANLPDFPLDNLQLVARMLHNNPAFSVREAILTLYPYNMALKKEQVDRVNDLFTTLKVGNHQMSPVHKISGLSTPENTIQIEIDDVSLTVNGGRNPHSLEGIVDLDHQRKLLATLIQQYSVGDICLIGQRGVGKATLTKRLVHVMNQSAEPMVLYEDMTSRDLIQQRVTTQNGDTVWRDSPLVRAAKRGTVVILNGFHRLHKSTASVLQRLIQDRELQLCDGTIMLRSDRYNELIKKGLTEAELISRNVLEIKDSFRIIALAEAPDHTKANKNWLTPEILSMFLFVEVRPLLRSEEFKIINGLHGNVDSQIEKVVNLSHNLREANDPTLKNLSGTLSTRQLLKIAHRMATFPEDTGRSNPFSTIYEILHDTFLAKFLPALPRADLERSFKLAGITRPKRSASKRTSSIVVQNDVLSIGNTTMKLQEPSDKSKVPSTLFYDVPQHVDLLERLLQDFIIGSHLLLVGNQGVGKNKLIDKLLQLMNKPREYIQLHRDTTVHSLTVQATLQNGQVIYEDSALVKAVKNGHVLVIDEADKAPVNVTCILRTLVEDGEMILSDGRKIVRKNFDPSDQGIIETHPDFRVVVLANRPGFPFLGNDFFSSLGDVFSCHAIDNPSPESEIYLLQQYAPSVPKEALSVLVNAFGELRNMADEGLLNYPYSTREVVNIVKHLEKYPEDPMSELVGNILDFDRYSPEALKQVTDVLAKHGLPIESYAKDELFALRRKSQLKASVSSVDRVSGLDVSQPKIGKVDSKNEPHVGGNTWAGGTGGRDTAGLGGKGGPFRLDAGHTVHQLSDAEKAAIPEEVKQAARAMNRKIFKERLKEIQMSEHDYKIYASYSEPIRKQVKQLKAVMEALQTKSDERQWQKYQTHGDLDDTRLIEGVVGEKNIYRRQTKQNPWADSANEKPNRLKIVADVSGSMYRFNGLDSRLDRELEAIVMIMEGLEGFDKKIVYDVVGHSGDDWDVPFIQPHQPPPTDKERLQAIRCMHLHSQFCMSGDNTVKAAEEAVKSLAKEDYENPIAIVLSDANMARYGIQPEHLAKALRSEPKVRAYIIFIGNWGEEADEINARMPAGLSYVCMDVSNLPQILKQIFTTALQ